MKIRYSLYLDSIRGGQGNTSLCTWQIPWPAPLVVPFCLGWYFPVLPSSCHGTDSIPSLSLPSENTTPAPSRPLCPPGDRSLLVTGRPTRRRLLALSSWHLIETTPLNQVSPHCVGTRRLTPGQCPTQGFQGSSWQCRLTQGTLDLIQHTQSGDSIHAINRWTRNCSNKLIENIEV